MMRKLVVRACIAAYALLPTLCFAATNHSPVTIRTETYASPPYSSVTYYIYERDGEILCTKRTTQNKFDEVENEYFKGAYKPDEIQMGFTPTNEVAPVPISSDKMGKHYCLKKFGIK